MVNVIKDSGAPQTLRRMYVIAILQGLLASGDYTKIVAGSPVVDLGVVPLAFDLADSAVVEEAFRSQNGG